MKTLLVIFGITGDLSTRKLLPALSNILKNSEAMNLDILGVSRREVDVDRLVLDSTGNQELAAITDIFSMDVAEAKDYQKLKETIATYKSDQTLIYLSVPPGASARIVDFLGEAGINTPGTHLLFEKPFGFDLASAQDFMDRIRRHFTEAQSYRIDHYMAKEVAAELLRQRTNADTHHHHWDASTVKSVLIVASEKIGIEGRAQFYEQTGALRDFIQGHLMQLLSLVLMHRPTIDAGLPAKRLKALQLLAPADPTKAVRGQYEGYQEEVQNPGSMVETYVSLQLESNDPNWKGVGIRLVMGKALHEKRSYIEVTYTDGRMDIFEEGKVPVPPGMRQLDAYERVLLEAMAGRRELFTSSEEVLRSWEILAPIQDAWNMGNGELFYYPVGTSKLG